MRMFTCVIDPEGLGIPASTHRAHELLPRSRGIAFVWNVFDGVSVLTGGDDDCGDPLVVTDGDRLAVGIVRLDNRSEFERCGFPGWTAATDLELVLRTVAQRGSKCIREFLGDFAFVLWNASSRVGVAACDAFAIKKLYYSERNGFFAFSSRAEGLALNDRYEVQYLAELVANCTPSSGLTVYAGVRALPSGTMATLERAKLTTRRYWSAGDFEPEPHREQPASELTESCRRLLVDALRTRVTADGGTWAQLSGGMDSSSLVSTAQWMAQSGLLPAGLGGTVTYVDRQGTGTDEREYADAVVTRWGVRNESIIDPPIWHDPNYALPRTDQPRANLLFYPRERRLCDIVRRAGGRVLLTGVGGDELFTGTMFFFADWLARGHVWPAVREMLRRAAIGRVSFWELAYRNAILPLFPPSVQQHLVREQGQLPCWVPRATARKYDLGPRTFAVASYAGRFGRKHQDTVVTHLVALGSVLEYGVIEDILEVRHPFLYRPLVEFALRLSPELCARPYARKWVLREAMQGILPEAVRTRVGKSTPAELYASGLITHRRLLEPLAREPILGDLGVVDPAKLRTAFNDLPYQPHRRDEQHAAIHPTLITEAWLQIRSGRWPREGHIGSPESATICPSI